MSSGNKPSYLPCPNTQTPSSQVWVVMDPPAAPAPGCWAPGATILHSHDPEVIQKNNHSFPVSCPPAVRASLSVMPLGAQPLIPDQRAS